MQLSGKPTCKIFNPQDQSSDFLSSPHLSHTLEHTMDVPGFAIVTSGASDIGSACAMIFARDGGRNGFARTKGSCNTTAWRRQGLGPSQGIIVANAEWKHSHSILPTKRLWIVWLLEWQRYPTAWITSSMQRHRNKAPWRRGFCAHRGLKKDLGCGPIRNVLCASSCNMHHVGAKPIRLNIDNRPL